MAWNQSGDNGQNHSPWGGGRPGGNSEGGGNKGGRGQEPPGLDDIFRKLSRKLGGLGGGKGTGSGGDSSLQGPRPQLGGRTIAIAAAAIVITRAANGFYAIKEAERGVVTRFGKFSHLVEPGLNRRPMFIGEVKPVDVEAVHELATSSVMLTPDKNVMRVEMNVQYRVTSPEKYLYSVTNPDGSLRQATDSVLRGVIGKCTMDRILTEGRTMIRDDTQRELKEAIRPYDMGITPLNINFQAAYPPEEVEAAFDDAVATHENKQRYIREAEAYTNEVQPRANGQAQRILEGAHTCKAQTILEVQGKVACFTKLLPKYKAAPEITCERLYIETMGRMLGNARRVLVNDKSGNLIVPLLDQILRGSNAPAARGDNGTSNLLRLLPVSPSVTSGTSNTSPTSQSGIMDQRRVNAQCNDYQRQRE